MGNTIAMLQRDCDRVAPLPTYTVHHPKKSRCLLLMLLLALMLVSWQRWRHGWWWSWQRWRCDRCWQWITIHAAESVVVIVVNSNVFRYDSLIWHRPY